MKETHDYYLEEDGEIKWKKNLTKDNLELMEKQYESLGLYGWDDLPCQYV